MKTLRFLLVMALGLVLVISAGVMVSSAADGGRSGGTRGAGGHDGVHSDSFRLGGDHDGRFRHGGRGSSFVVIGDPFWGYPWYSPWYYPFYYPYYYPYYPQGYHYAPSVVLPSEQEEQEYVEHSQPRHSSRSADVWYYCPESKAYYPYVRECQDGWQTVPAQPPSEKRR